MAAWLELHQALQHLDLTVPEGPLTDESKYHEDLANGYTKPVKEQLGITSGLQKILTTKKDLPKSWTDPSSRHEMVPGVEKPRRHRQKEWETPSLQSGWQSKHVPCRRTTAKPPVAAQLWPPCTLVACLYIDWWWVYLTLHRGVTPSVGPVHPLPRMECWIA